MRTRSCSRLPTSRSSNAASNLRFSFFRSLGFSGPPNFRPTIRLKSPCRHKKIPAFSLNSGQKRQQSLRSQHNFDFEIVCPCNSARIARCPEGPNVLLRRARRSTVDCLHGMEEVTGSNPVESIKRKIAGAAAHSDKPRSVFGPFSCVLCCVSFPQSHLFPVLESPISDVQFQVV